MGKKPNQSTNSALMDLHTFQGNDSLIPIHENTRPTKTKKMSYPTMQQNKLRLLSRNLFTLSQTLRLGFKINRKNLNHGQNRTDKEFRQENRAA
jgi:hypothetical protein